MRLRLALLQFSAEFVIRKIKECVDAGVYDGDHKVAIIYRKNSQSRAFEEVCVHQNIPYLIFGGATSFYKRHEIKDCLCFLRWLANGRHQGAMKRALVTPTRGIGKVGLSEFDTYCEVVNEHYHQNLPGKKIPTVLDVVLSLSNRSLTDNNNVPDPSNYISKRALNRLEKFSEQMQSIHETVGD